ncbi:hypothetical protein PRZ48_010097 [Zasmidium cellare]|uniref:Uncharacterized protein n=1 Tax=Zasmidium cellare TaxID=395010 RepID=A0ABR0EDK5_ZASCE|nr:hypothetical protein PRZ48_010097 [Zasmidium cellare]
MDRTPKRMKRGVDDSTATRIRYQSPPPRDDDGITAYLASGRNIKHLEPRHTPPDACLAQDRALCKAEVLKAAEESAKLPRRDSAVNTDAASETKEFVPFAEEFEIQPELSSPKLPFRSSPTKANTKPNEQVARAPSSFSTSPRSRNTPAITVEAASPPQQIDSLLKSPKSDRRRSSTRRRTNRGSSRDDLEIDGNALLDPTKSTEGQQITLYKDKSGKWYEVDIPGRPDWALDEKTIFKAVPAKRRQSQYLKRHE